MQPTIAPLPARALRALRHRGPRYAWHKALRKTLGPWPGWKRRLLYTNARRYWTLRGGDDYFREQEGQPSRSARAAWLADRVAAYRPASILEIGCGYGKQLRALGDALPEADLSGVDFSPSQLSYARGHLGGCRIVGLGLADGQRLPFPDGSFDLVLTSAVILHNPPVIAQRIRREAIRVARRWVAHNEDTDRSYNRFGYDTAAWYRAAGFWLAEVGPIPIGTDIEIARSQFCVADLDGPSE